MADIQDADIGTAFFSFYMNVPATDVALTPAEQARLSGPHRFWLDATRLCRVFGKEFKDFVGSERGKGLLRAFQQVPFDEGGMPGGPDDLSHMYTRGKTGFGNSAWICPRLLPHLVFWLSPALSIKINHVMVEVLLGHLSSFDGRAAFEQVGLAAILFHSTVACHASMPSLVSLVK